ncbi:WD40 repeat 2 [Hirsutella rhossiliensis]|uniref:WD40 repeat 2 n=1 Tax=Hirsutella rhossiliensis TaxID=111463 RepID=A0A9P8N7E3_9HYPO|nr:WD40 repeat 2 [Hirsutella rhossiliensis]KAH0965997.1 WD40 repeat 2 [Hirsutella rhossiliensis]
MSKMHPLTPSPSGNHQQKLSQGRRLGLTLRYRRLCSTTEINQVGLTPCPTSSPSDLHALAVYADPQTAQFWVDVFGIGSQRGYTKAAGSHAVMAPLAGIGSGRFASLRSGGAVQPGQGVEHRGNSLVVHDLVTGKTALEIKQATAGPLAWSCQGTALAAGEARNRVGVWDARSGARIGRVVGHIDEVTHAAFTPDSKLVTLSRDGTVRITDPQTARTLSKLEVDATSGTNPRALAVSPDGQSVVSLWGATLLIWLPCAGQLTSYGLHAARGSEGWPLCISPDCRWMACRTEDGFDIVDVAAGSVVWEGGGGAAMFTAAAFSTDGKVLVLGRMDGVVEVWDVEEREG